MEFEVLTFSRRRFTPTRTATTFSRRRHGGLRGNVSATGTPPGARSPSYTRRGMSQGQRHAPLGPRGNPCKPARPAKIRYGVPGIMGFGRWGPLDGRSGTR